MTKSFQITPKWAVTVAVVAISYFIVAQLSLQLAFENTNTSPVWPPTGFALAALVLLGIRTWPGLTVGAFAANLVAFLRNDILLEPALAMSTTIAIGNTLEAVAGTWMLQRFCGGDALLERGRNVLWYIALPVVTSTMISATVGTGSLWAGGIIPKEIASYIWWTWWLGDAVGSVVVVPFLLTIWRLSDAGFRGWRGLEVVLLLALLIGTCELTFGGWVGTAGEPYPIVYALISITMLLAFRCGSLGATMAIVLVASIATWDTITGSGPFVRESLNESLLLLQFFLGVTALTAYLLTGVLNERQGAVTALRASRETLEQRVQERTAELSQANEALARSNEELDDFAYIVSHDLKEPLRGISNYANFILEDYGDRLDDKGREMLETLPRLAGNLGALIDELLHLSRVGRSDLGIKETDLNGVVEDVVDSLKASFGERQVEIRAPRPLPTVSCDAVRVTEVFRNLITNAAKYNDKDERLIEIGYESKGGAATAVNKLNDQGSLTFYVKDNGIGIPEKHRNTVFDIFKRLHGRDKFGGGTGSGMTIVKRIVERYGGRIWLDSEPGVGSTFYFTLSGGQPQRVTP